MTSSIPPYRTGGTGNQGGAINPISNSCSSPEPTRRHVEFQRSIYPRESLPNPGKRAADRPSSPKIRGCNGCRLADCGHAKTCAKVDWVRAPQVNCLEGSTFMVSNLIGDVGPDPDQVLGLFYRDMRHLS